MIAVVVQILLTFPKVHRGSDMKPFKFAVGLVFAASALLAQAVPLTTNAPSAYAGDTVIVVLTEPSPANLIGVTINFTYDNSILTYISGLAGNIDPAPSLVLGLEDTLVDPVLGGTASIAFDAPIDIGGSLLELVFQINAGVAPGTTLVNFSCFDYGSGLGCTDYAFEPVSATVTVLERATTPIPLPGTLPLLGLAVAALWWSRRRMH